MDSDRSIEEPFLRLRAAMALPPVVSDTYLGDACIDARFWKSAHRRRDPISNTLIDLTTQQAHVMLHRVEDFLHHDDLSGGGARSLWPPMFAECLPEVAHLPLDRAVAAVALRIVFDRDRRVGGVHCIEYFAGKGMLTYAHLQLGVSVISKYTPGTLQ